MARYTQHYTISILPEKLKSAIASSLEACKLSVIYSTDDYFMAREATGEVTFSQLVTVEVLIHQSAIEGEQVKLTCVTKNEELPLKTNNHCSQMAEQVGKAFKRNQDWKLLEAIG